MLDNSWMYRTTWKRHFLPSQFANGGDIVGSVNVPGWLLDVRVSAPGEKGIPSNGLVGCLSRLQVRPLLEPSAAAPRLAMSPQDVRDVHWAALYSRPVALSPLQDHSAKEPVCDSDVRGLVGGKRDSSPSKGLQIVRLLLVSLLCQVSYDMDSFNKRLEDFQGNLRQYNDYLEEVEEIGK